VGLKLIYPLSPFFVNVGSNRTIVGLKLSIVKQFFCPTATQQSHHCGIETVGAHTIGHNATGAAIAPLWD